MNMTTGDPQQELEGHRTSSRAKKAVDIGRKEAQDVTSVALGKANDAKVEALQERWENWLAWPVLIAALLSVPAVFLTLLDEPFMTIGNIGLYVATAVLIVETVVFFLISPQKIAWVIRNWWLIGLTIVTVLAVIFSLGPMQVFRTVRSVGALRVLRAKQVAKAGESLANKSRSRWRRGLGKVLATVVVGTFVVLALVVPESEARTSLENFVGAEGVPYAAAAAGLITVVVMYLLVRTPRKQRTSDSLDRGEAPQEGLPETT